jgi:hypothetical protein
LESFPTVSESTFGQFICALRRIASFTLSGARFLLVLVLLSAVRYLPLPIFTALNEIPGGLSCTVVQASTVRLTKSVGPILSFLSHDLVSEPCVRLVPTYFLAPDKSTSPLLHAIARFATSGYGPMKDLLWL